MPNPQVTQFLSLLVFSYTGS